MTRRFQFSLRALAVAVALLAVWLAAVTNRAREQRQIVAQLETLGWDVSFDWHDEAEEPHGPAWLRRVVGDDYFQKVVAVSSRGLAMDETRMLESIPLLQRLPDMRFVGCFGDIPELSLKTLEASLPHCQVTGPRWAPPALPQGRAWEDD